MFYKPGAWKLVKVLSSSNAISIAIIKKEATRYIRKSHAKLVNQNVVGLRPVIICKCLAPLVLSTKGKIRNRETNRLMAIDSRDP